MKKYKITVITNFNWGHSISHAEFDSVKECKEHAKELASKEEDNPLSFIFTIFARLLNDDAMQESIQESIIDQYGFKPAETDFNWNGKV